MGLDEDRLTYKDALHLLKETMLKMYIYCRRHAVREGAREGRLLHQRFHQSLGQEQVSLKGLNVNFTTFGH